MNYRPTVCALLLLGTGVCAANPARAGEKYWIDNDAGFDTDDQLANILSNCYFNGDIAGISTTLYLPDEKAKLNKLTFSEMGSSVTVYPGEGFYRRAADKDPADPGADFKAFLARYPEWPAKEFKDPADIRQGAAYRELYGERFDRQQIEPANSATQAIADAARLNKGELVFIAQGPLTNLAKALERDPGIGRLFKRIVIMGGWKRDRLGYNSIIDYQATQRVFKMAAASGLAPITLANSDALADKQLDLGPGEIEILVKAAKRTRIGSAIIKDMRNWRKIFEEGRTMTGVSLADPLAVYLARHPDSDLFTFSCVKVRFRTKPARDVSGEPFVPGEGLTMFNHAGLIPPLLEKRETVKALLKKGESCPAGTVKVINKLEKGSGGEVPARTVMVNDIISGLEALSQRGPRSGD